VVALVATWPLVLHLGTRLPSLPSDSTGRVDPLFEAWTVAWDGHAALHQPLHLFQANIFWPARDSLAFSDSLIGYTPAGLVGAGAGAAAVRYDLLVMLSYALAFGGAYALARELGAATLGGWVAGLAYALSPWRLGQADHLHVLSIGGIPLTAWLLLRGYRRRSARTLLAGWLVACWQVSLGFGIGLEFLYALAALAVGWLAIRLRRRDGLSALPRPAVAATGAGTLALLGISLALAAPYLRVLDRNPEALRTLAEVHRYSPPVASLAAAAPDNLIWGGTSRILSDTPERFEKMLFPGLTILVLAVAGIRSPSLARPVRVGIALGVLVSVVFAMGLTLGGDWSPYRLLWEIAPGWKGIRTPARIFALTTLGLAVLAAAGADRVWARLGPRTASRRLVAIALPALIVVEGLGPVPTTAAPKPPVRLREVPAPLLALPSSAVSDSLWEFWSTDGFPRMVNGHSGVKLREQRTLRRAANRFPDAGSVTALSAAGVRSVVIDPRLAQRARWRRIAGRPPAVPGLARRQLGPLTVYALPRAR